MFSYITSFVYDSNVTKMKNRLQKDLGYVKVDEFIEMLKSTNSIIAGSYPLQVYHGETWKCSDIDIFTTSEKMRDYIKKQFKDEKIIEQKNNTYSYTNFTHSVVTEYNSPSIKVQLITLKNYSKAMDILNNFDFNFCKATFDGTEFTISDEAMLKEGKFDLTRVPSFKSYYRLIKYEKRGFTVSNREELIYKKEKAHDKIYRHKSKIELGDIVIEGHPSKITKGKNVIYEQCDS